jgi:hypothetical protein
MLDAVASRAAKERGQQIALDFDTEWKVRVLEEMRAWLAIRRAAGHLTMTMEQFRADAKHHPRRPQAWGALVKPAIGAGLIALETHPDGSPVFRPAESVKTHGHFIRVYKILPSSFSAPAAETSPTVQQHARPEALPFVGAASGCGSETAYTGGRA